MIMTLMDVDTSSGVYLLPGGVRYIPEVQLFAGELFFNDTSCLDSRSQHVLLSGEVV